MRDASAILSASTSLSIQAAAALRNRGTLLSSVASLDSGDGGSLSIRDPEAGDIFVDLDRVTNGSGTAGSPYQPSQAAIAVWRALNAGQQLVFMNGSGSGTFTPINVNGANPGNAGNRITVRTMPGHPKAIWNFPTDGRSYHVSYWDFRDLDLRTDGCGLRFGYNGWGAQNGGGGGPDGNTSFVRVIDCNGIRTAGGILDGKTTDNRAIVTAARSGSGSSGADNISVLRCVFTGPAGEGNNQSLIWFDYLQASEIIGCVLDQAANPIYYKHTNTTAPVIAIVKNCIVRRGGRGMSAAVNWLQILNTAFYNCTIGGDEEGGGVNGGYDWNVSHCTLAGDSDWFMGYEDETARARLVALNNVMVGTSRLFDAPLNSQDGGNFIDYSATTTGNHYRRGGSSRTMANYRTTYPPNEANGLAGAISLAGGSAPGNNPADWALVAGSVGIGNASDGGNRGVDETKLLTLN